MQTKRTYDFLTKPRRNFVLTDESDSEMNYSPTEHSTPGVTVVTQTLITSSEEAIHSERNKIMLLLKTLPVHTKLLFSMFFMIIVNLLLSSGQFYVRKNTSLKDIDIYSICGFVGIVPHIFVLSLGILIEGKISRRPSLMDCLSICSSGVIIYGVLPLAYFKVLFHFNSNFILLIEFLIVISVSIGSYIFKIEKLPKMKYPGAIILLSGVLISVILSAIIIFSQINHDLKEPLSLSNTITIVIITLLLFITHICARNYQHVRFLKNQRSMFNERPITFIGMNGVLASPIIIIVYLIVTIVRWDSVRDKVLTRQYLIFLIYGCIVLGIIINILTILVITVTSPLYAYCFFPFRIIFDFIFQYAFFGKKSNKGMYVLSVFALSSAVLGFIGKYKLLKQTSK